MASKSCMRLAPLRSSVLLALLLLLAGLVGGCATSSPSSPSPTSTPVPGIRGIFHEYTLPPSQFVPRNITMGPDGNLWFTEGGRIARITPLGKISEFKLSAPTSAQSIATGPDGNLWFTDQSKIGRMTLTGKVSEFSLPIHQFPAGSNPIKAPAGSGPNQALAITAGPDGNLWFTEIGPDEVGSSIGRITTSGKITEFPLPSTHIFLSSITAGPDGNLWFTGIGTNNGLSMIGMITPQGKIREFTFLHSIFGSITRGPDGNLWFTAFQYGVTGAEAGKIENITTAGKLSDFPLPTTSYVPTSITFGTDQTLWFIEVEVTVSDPSGKNGKIGHLV